MITSWPADLGAEPLQWLGVAAMGFDVNRLVALVLLIFTLGYIVGYYRGVASAHPLLDVVFSWFKLNVVYRVEAAKLRQLLGSAGLPFEVYSESDQQLFWSGAAALGGSAFVWLSRRNSTVRALSA